MNKRDSNYRRDAFSKLTAVYQISGVIRCFAVIFDEVIHKVSEMVTLLQGPQSSSSDVRVNTTQVKIICERMQMHVDLNLVADIHETQYKL